MAEREVIFQAINVRKEFDVTIALKGADITIRRGEIRGLIGENGSGKSTIMSIAAGMQGATGGEMLYKGNIHDPARGEYNSGDKRSAQHICGKRKRIYILRDRTYAQNDPGGAGVA